RARGSARSDTPTASPARAASARPRGGRSRRSTEASGPRARARRSGGWGVIEAHDLGDAGGEALAGEHVVADDDVIDVEHARRGRLGARADVARGAVDRGASSPRGARGEEDR